MTSSRGINVISKWYMCTCITYQIIIRSGLNVTLKHQIRLRQRNKENVITQKKKQRGNVYIHYDNVMVDQLMLFWWNTSYVVCLLKYDSNIWICLNFITLLQQSWPCSTKSELRAGRHIYGSPQFCCQISTNWRSTCLLDPSL